MGDQVMHTIVTLAWSADGTSTTTVTTDGLITVPAGATRQDVYRRARADAEAHSGNPPGAVVLFFDAEPNQPPTEEPTQ